MGHSPDHLKRWLTGLVGIPILIYVIGLGPGWLLRLVLCAAAILGTMEFYRITVPDLPGPVRWVQYALILLLFLALQMREFFLIPIFPVLWAFVPMMVLVLLYPSPTPQQTATLGKASLGPLYAALPLVLLALIGMRPSGASWIFFLLTVVFLSDTGAFYVGRHLGKHPLHRRISPGKTWEGVVGGWVAGMGGGVLFLLVFPVHPLDPKIFLLMPVMIGMGQLGDLSESLIKRSHGWKDSGTLFPGHGGILDRVDALLFAIPVLFVYLTLFCGIKKGF